MLSDELDLLAPARVATAFEAWCERHDLGPEECGAHEHHARSRFAA